MSPSKPSPSVIAAGIVAILGSVFAILGCAFALIGIAMLSSAKPPEALPASVKSIAMAVMLFFMAVAVFGVFSGIGLLRLKNWARISALVWAGITVFFSASTLLFILFIPFPTPPGQQPMPLVLVKAFMFIFYGTPLGIGIWWLILFNRPGIRAQFFGTGLPDQLAEPTGPRCPLPVVVVAAFLVFSFVTVLAFPLFRIPLPVIVFGRMVHGPLGFGIFALTALLSLAAAIGLLKLKRWSYPLILGLQSFWLLSGAVTFLSSSFERNMQLVYSEMHLPEAYTISQMYLHTRSFALAGLLPSLFILGILLYYRHRFLEAADEVERLGG
jgi:hypothetical protein